MRGLELTGLKAFDAEGMEDSNSTVEGTRGLGAYRD